MSRSQPLSAVSREQIWSEHIQKELRFMQPNAHYSINPKTLSYIPDKPTQSREMNQYWTERKERAKQEENERKISVPGSLVNSLSLAGSNSLDWVTKYNQAKLERERTLRKEEEERRVRGEQREMNAREEEKTRQRTSDDIPLHLQSTVSLAPKYQTKSVQQKAKDKEAFLDEFLTTLSHTTLSPRSKYNVPLTTSQEIGWDQDAYAMLIEPDKVRPLVTRSDVTKFADDYIAACGVSQFSTKHFKHTSKK